MEAITATGVLSTTLGTFYTSTGHEIVDVRISQTSAGDELDFSVFVKAAGSSDLTMVSPSHVTAINDEYPSTVIEGIALTEGSELIGNSTVADNASFLVSGFRITTTFSSLPVSSSQYVGSIPNDYVVSWDLNSVAAGSVIQDRTGNYNLQIIGNYQTIPGVWGNTIKLTGGSPNRMDLPTGGLGGFPWTPTSISMFLNKTDSVFALGVGTSWTDSKRRLYINCTNNALAIEWGQNGLTVNFSGTVTTNREWFHLLIQTIETGQGTAYEVFIDGVSQGQTADGTIRDAYDPIQYVGSLLETTYQSLFHGVDVPFMWDRYLSSEEIAACAAFPGGF